MENLQKVIEQTEKELASALQKSGNEREIACLALRLQRLRETENMTEAPEDQQNPKMVRVPDWPGACKSYRMPENYMDIAKYHEAEMSGLLPGADNHSGELCGSAAARLTDMLNRIELLGLAAEAAPELPELPGAAELSSLVRELAEKNNGTIPPDELRKMWAGICDLYRDEWRLMFKFIDIARIMQTDACRKLAKMTDYLKSVRGEIQRVGREYGSPDEIVKDNPQITVHLSGEMHQILRHDNDTLNFAFCRPEGEEL